MKKAGIVLNVISMTLLHLVCCGLPLIIALGGSIGLYFSLKAYTGWVLAMHLFTVIFMIWFLYRPGVHASRRLNLQRGVFWIFTLVTLGTYFFTHSSLFKSEEEMLRQQHFERIFKSK